MRPINETKLTTSECQFLVGQFPISDQFCICRDIARQIRQRLGPGAPIRWDVAVLSSRQGLIRMIGYRTEPT